MQSASADVQAEVASLPRRAVPAVGTVLLEVKDAVKKFGGLVANDHMNLGVAAGEMLALIGPNGAGKSTMFNCISGVDPPDLGRDPLPRPAH